jgi:hypothetical protein
MTHAIHRRPTSRVRGERLLKRRSMLEGLKESWRTFQSAPPGRRFVKLHDARAGGPPPIVFYVIGALLLVGGVVLLLIPGPGLLLIAFGGALIARQSLWLAKRLDRLERVFRGWARKTRTLWQRSSTLVRAAIVAVMAMVAAGAGYAGYLCLFAD